MKSFVTFLKSPVGRFHTTFAVFILSNLLTGLIGRTGYYPVLSTVHFFTGLLILAAPAVFLIASKNRAMILKAFGRMVLPNKADFTKRRVMALLLKATALVVAVGTLVNAVTGVLYRSGVAGPVVFPIHLAAFYGMLAAVPLHALLGLLQRRGRKH